MSRILLPWLHLAPRFSLDIGDPAFNGDDLQGLSDGETSSVTSGVQFLENGAVNALNYDVATHGFDDLSSESDGAISSITGGATFSGNGSFVSITNLDTSLDDLSSESDGAISSVTGGTDWSGNGSFFAP